MFCVGAAPVFMGDAAVQLGNTLLLWLVCRTLLSHVTTDPFLRWNKPLCEMHWVGHLSTPLSFIFFFLTWIPAGSQCKLFQPWFTMEQEGFSLENHSVLNVLVVLGKHTGCSQAGQDHTSREVWLTQFPHWLSTQSALVNIAPPRSSGWGAGGRVQLIYGWAA